MSQAKPVSIVSTKVEPSPNREQKIKFAVFIPPKRSDFTRIYRQKCGPDHREYIRKLTDIGLSVPIFGRFDQLEDIGDSVYFVEAYHLNA